MMISDDFLRAVLRFVCDSKELIKMPNDVEKLADLVGFTGVSEALVDRAVIRFQERMARSGRQTLGVMVECAVFSLLEQIEQVAVLAENKQIYNGKQTIGELDTLLRVDQKLVHAEIAVKFYMAYPPEKPEMWLGPNAKDSFKIKAENLLHHQIRLSEKVMVKRQLCEEGLMGEGEMVGHALCVKGVLFHHALHAVPALPDEAADDCERGRWCFAHEWAETYPQLEAEGLHACMLERLEWIAASSVISDVRKMEVTAELNRPLMLVLCKREVAEKQSFTAVERFFIMPDNWPEKEDVKTHGSKS